MSAQRGRATRREKGKLEGNEEVGGVRVERRMKRKGKFIEGVEAEIRCPRGRGKTFGALKLLGARIDVRAPAHPLFGDPA